MWQRCAPWLAVIALSACDERRAPPPPEASVTEEGLSLADVHQPARALLALGTSGETAWRITVATDALSCDELRRAYPERPPGAPGTRLDFWLRQPIGADGTALPWAVRSAFISDDRGGRGLTTRGASLEAVAETADHVKVSGLDLACGDGDRAVAYTGAVLAKNCGRVARPEEDRPQADLALSIAGQRFEVHGASLFPRGKRQHLRLSHAPHRCESVFTEGYDLFVDVVLEGEPPKVAFASLSGDRFPEDPSGSGGKEAFAVSADGPLAAPLEPSSGEAPDEVALTLKGELDLSGYKLALDGKLRAQRCYDH